MCTSIQKVIVGENFNAINSMHCIAYEYGLYKNKSANDIGEEMLWKIDDANIELILLMAKVIRIKCGLYGFSAAHVCNCG